MIKVNRYREQTMTLYTLGVFCTHHGVFCPGSVLPVHPDAVKDDGEADVEDEVDPANNLGNDCK